jgi:4-oxalocrotonate tautomerase
MNWEWFCRNADRLLFRQVTENHQHNRKESTMPFVTVKLIEGVFTQAQKQEMIRKLTDTMVSIEGENMRPVTWVVIEEVKSGDWGLSGNPLTANDVKALAAGRAKVASAA